jgi:flagellar hook-length control protein FliK
MESKSINTAVSSVLSIASGTGASDVGGSTEVDFAKVISAKHGSAGKQSDQQQGKKPSTDGVGQKPAAGNDDTLIMSADPLALKLYQPKNDAKALEAAAAIATNAALLPGSPAQDGAALSNNAVETDAMLAGQDAVLAQAVGADAILAASGEGTVVVAVDMVADGIFALSATEVTALPVIGDEGGNETASDLTNNLQASGDQSQAGQDETSRAAALLAMNSNAEPGSDDITVQSPITSVAVGSEVTSATATSAVTLPANSAAVSHTAGKGLTNGKVTPVSDEAVAIAQNSDPDGVDAGTKTVATPATTGPAFAGTSTRDEIAAIVDKVGVSSQGPTEQAKVQTVASDALAKSALTGSDDVSKITVKTVPTSSETTKSQAIGDGSKLEVEARATVAASSDEIETPSAETKAGKAIEQSLADPRTTDAKLTDAKMVGSSEKGATSVSSKPADGGSAEAKLADIKATDSKPAEPKIAEHADAKSSTIEGAAGKETTARPQSTDRIAASGTPQKAVIKDNAPSSGKSDTNLAPEKPLVNAKRDMKTAQQKLAVAAETTEVDAAVRPAAKTAVTPVSAAQATVIKQSTETAAQIAPVQTEMTKQIRRTMESAASDKKATIEGSDGKLKDVTVEQIPQKPAPTIDRLARNIALESASPVAAEDDKAASEMMAPVNAGSGKPQANIAVSSNTTTPAQNLAGLERWSNSIVDVQKQGWTQSLVRRVAAMPTNGGRLVITLQPASLGKISVSMAEGRRGMDIRMRTETSATAALLNDAESRISQLLQSSGMQLNSFSADTSGSFAENENSSDGSGSRDQSSGQNSARTGQELPENAEQSIAQQGDGLVNLIA